MLLLQHVHDEKGARTHVSFYAFTHIGTKQHILFHSLFSQPRKRGEIEEVIANYVCT